MSESSGAYLFRYGSEADLVDMFRAAGEVKAIQNA